MSRVRTYSSEADSHGNESDMNSESVTPVPELRQVCVVDTAVDVKDAGGRKVAEKPDGKANGGGTEEGPPRLVLISSKIKNAGAMQSGLLPNITLVQYKYENSTLDGILGSVAKALGTQKVESIAIIMHGSNGTINVCGKEEKVVTKENILELQSIRDFFLTLTTNHLDKSWVNARLDFLACNVAQNVDGGLIAREIETFIGVPVGISKDINGADIPMQRIGEDSNTPLTVGELYFKSDKLKGWTGNQQSMAGFQKIRTVGKGAYGAAVLYKKKDDDSLVILKEINMHDLSAGERALALNEVKVLAMLEHPNIISYFDSFEEDGTLMIEMEYADGGTLAQFLQKQDKSLEENVILGMFKQMVAAIRHIHEHNILHRDLKTANIFLTKEGVVKMGDFGISKMLSTANKGANTVLGTPYYISPEMCEGKPYNDKSDIWALGCILYEMACLQKTFEGSNLPALVNKIMKGQFAPVKGNYSQDFKNLVRDMLEKDPKYRPSAYEIMYKKLPELMTRYLDPTTDLEDDTSEGGGFRKKKTRSVLYYLETFNVTLSPVDLPARVKIREVAVGSDHVIVVTTEQMVFSWGDGRKGQLGHGNLDSLYTPTLVEALKGKSITKACCGEGFSVFASDNGIVMTCGDGSTGCLGHGDWVSISRPRLIESLLSMDVYAVSCGPQHVIIVGGDGEILSWGRGANGRLGLGNEEDYCQPMQVNISEPVIVKSVFCGVDGTMLLTDVGSVLAFGSNEYNKLGLNQRQGFLMAMKNIFNKNEVEGSKMPTLVKALARHRVMGVSLGVSHTAVLVESGHVFTFGRNNEGQLGVGNTKQQNAPIEVKYLSSADQNVTRVQCGELYTVASVANGKCHGASELYYWGTRFKNPPLDDQMNSSRTSKDGSTGSQTSFHRASVTSINTLDSSKGMSSLGNTHAESLHDILKQNDDKTGGTADSNIDRQMSADNVFAEKNITAESTHSSLNHSGGFRPISSTPRRLMSANSANRKDTEKDSSKGPEMTELLLVPTHVLRLDNSKDHVPNDSETVILSHFACHGENVFVQVETTAPPPLRKKMKKRRSLKKRLSTSGTTIEEMSKTRGSTRSDIAKDDDSSATSEMDTLGTVPSWLREELKQSAIKDDGNEADNTSDDEKRGPFIPDASLASIQINKEFKAGKANKIIRKDGGIPLSPSKVKRKSKFSSSESGVEFTPADNMSSDSDNEAMNNAVRRAEEAVKKATAAIPPSRLVPPARKISTGTPSPYNAKGGVNARQNQLRVKSGKGRGRNPDVGGIREEPLKSAGFISGVTQRRREENLMSELDRLKDEKRKTEDRLQAIEQKSKQQEEQIRLEAEKAAEAQEKRVQGELQQLRTELLDQNNKMQENLNVMLALQEQLVKVQSDKDPGRSSSAKARSSTGKESRVCVIQ